MFPERTPSSPHRSPRPGFTPVEHLPLDENLKPKGNPWFGTATGTRTHTKRAGDLPPANPELGQGKNPCEIRQTSDSDPSK